MAGVGLRELAGTRALKVGSFVVEFATPGIGHILKHAGCEYAMLDMEHSGFGFETVKAALRWFEAAGLPVIVRPPSQAAHHVARAADMGAEGIMVPMVGTAEQAAALVAAARYVPEGQRGVALGIAHDAYAPGAVHEKLAAANRRMTCVALIETAEGVRNVDAIAATPGIDILWIGHFDLTCSLGVPGRFDSAEFEEAVAAVVKACRKHGKSLGRMAGDPAEGIALFEQGHDFICYSGDVWLLQKVVREGLDAIRAGCAGVAADAVPPKKRKKG